LLFVVEFAVFFLSSPSRPDANSRSASGRFGIGAPSGTPSMASRSPPSPNRDEPLKILDKPDLMGHDIRVSASYYNQLNVMLWRII